VASFSNMANAPPVSSGTQQCQRDASSVLKNDIEDAINNHMEALDAIATKHGL
jgi:hypothetical protein